jgi:putative ABC transport system ATP-binding protein
MVHDRDAGGRRASPRGSHQCLTLIAEAVADLAQTIVMVTHDARAAACSSRVIQLRDGAVLSDTSGDRAPIRPPP